MGEGGGGPEGAGSGGEVLFSPARSTTPEQARQQAAALVDALRQRLGDEWREEWAEKMQWVPWDLLPLALTEG